MRNLRYLLTLSVLGSVAALSQANAQMVSADHVEEQIRSSGAKDVVSDMARNPAAWSQVIDHVASGDSAWLKVAEQLKPATHAEFAATLDGAVSSAIQRNPDGVLALIGPVFRVSDVCRTPTAEPSGESPKVFVERTRDALEGVTRPALATRRYECLQELPQAEVATASSQEPR